MGDTVDTEREVGAMTVVTRLRRLSRRTSAPGSGAAGLPTGPAARVLLAAVIVPLLFSPGDAVEGTDRGIASHVAAEGSSGPPMQQTQGATVTGQDREVRARPIVAEAVTTRRPHLVIRAEQALDPQDLFGVISMPEVDHIASTVELAVTLEVEDRLGEVPTGGEADEEAPSTAEISLLVVDAASFRPFTPEATAQSSAVWERLVDGELVVRHDVAQELQLPLGGTVSLEAPDGQTRLVRVGAFASNGSPPFADAIVAWSIGRELGVTSPRQLIVSLADEDDAGTVTERIGGLETAFDVEPIEAPERQQAAGPSSELGDDARGAELIGAGAHQFEPFSYVSHGDGMISIDPDWVARNIVSVQLPIFGGTARCHRTMVPQLLAALREVEAAGLDRHIDTSDYGGCWVPRHILFNPNRGLSMHAWGLAVDFNVSTNQYGAQPQMHPGIVEIFERWGFAWGGDWSTPDGMHFELRTVIEP